MNARAVVVLVALALVGCGPSDVMQSREAKECRALLAVEQGWIDVFEEAKWEADRAKKWNTDPDTASHVKVYGKRSENVFDIAERIERKREQAVASCVLKMKGGR